MVQIVNKLFEDDELNYNDINITQSIEYYNKFINDILRTDLNKLLDSKQKVFDELQSFLELKSNIELLIENKMNDMKTMINLGCECYTKAKVHDTSKIFINVGLDISVQFTLKEAIEFINKRENILNQKQEKITKNINIIKSKIDLMEHGIQDLKSSELNK